MRHSERIACDKLPHMNCKMCPKCGAKFMNGRLYWATGKAGDPEVLANLVCDLPQVQRGGGCINQFKGNPSKDTWAKRAAFSDAMAEELDIGDTGGSGFDEFLPGFHD